MLEYGWLRLPENAWAREKIQLFGRYITNLLYVHHGLTPVPEFETPKELRIEQMWDWTGQPWGGLPDGTSIGNPLHNSRFIPKQ
jgi:hypothetical protein